MAAEYISLLPSRRTPEQDQPSSETETFVPPSSVPASVPAPAPLAFLLAMVLFFYALFNVLLVGMSQASVPSWLYRSLLFAGVVVLLGVVVLFLLRMV